MKTLRTLLLTLLVGAGWMIPAAQTAKADVSFSFFYDSLGSHGDWIEVGDYGYCWRPRVSAGWRPYSDGYWAYTDGGWTWVSYEDYGWAVYHYGRWVDLDDEGWCWVPGYEWGPAWVSWRHSDRYVGWAPLPPEARWNVSVGFGFAVDRDCDIGPGYYNFCEVRDFGSPVLRPVLIDNRRNVTIINETTNVTNITVNKVNKTVYNGGPDFNTINQRTNRKVRAMKLVQKQDINTADAKGLRARAEGDELVVPAPKVKRDEKGRPDRIAKKVGKEKVNKGWANVQDPEEKKRVRAKLEQDAQAGAEAKPVGEREIAEVDAAIAKQPKEDKKHRKADANAEQPAGVQEGVAAEDADKKNRKKERGAAEGLQPFEGADKKGDEADQAAKQQRKAERQAQQDEAQQQEITRQKKQQEKARALEAGGADKKGDEADQAAKQQRKAERQAQEQEAQQQEVVRQKQQRKAERQAQEQEEQQQEVVRQKRQQEKARAQEAENAKRNDAEQAVKQQRKAERQQQAVDEERQLRQVEKQRQAKRQENIAEQQAQQQRQMERQKAQNQAMKQQQRQQIQQQQPRKQQQIQQQPRNVQPAGQPVPSSEEEKKKRKKRAEAEYQ